MSLLLLVLGILLAGAGAAAIGFGIPVNALPIGGTLITAGATALSAGLLLVGLSAAVAELSAIARNIKTGPDVRPARPKSEPAVVSVAVEPLPSRRSVPMGPIATETRIQSDVRPAPALPSPLAATPTPPVEPPISAIERLRSSSSIPRAERSMPVTEGVPLSPNGQQPHVEPPAEPPPPIEASTATAREPRLDFLFRSRQQARPASPAQPVPPQAESSFDALWPKRTGRGPHGDQPAEQKSEQQVDVRLEPAVEQAHAALPAPPPASSEPPAIEHAPPAPSPAPASLAESTPRMVAILKSGVVDGMAYTLYADGSIEAQLPQGTVRFGSIAELRAHIESNS
jgi:hypothetical protein